MRELNNQLLSEALKYDVCSGGASRIQHAKSNADLLQLYVEKLDFCLANDFPSNDCLKENGNSLLQKYGIRIDEVFETVNPENLILLGACSSKVSINDYAISQIFVKHNSGASVIISDHAFAVIDVFDNSVTSICASEESKVLVNVYGNAKLSYNTIGNARIKVVNKYKNTY